MCTLLLIFARLIECSSALRSREDAEVCQTMSISESFFLPSALILVNINDGFLNQQLCSEAIPSYDCWQGKLFIQWLVDTTWLLVYYMRVEMRQMEVK